MVHSGEQIGKEEKTLIFVCLEQTISAFVQNLRKTQNFSKQKARKEFLNNAKNKKKHRKYTTKVKT